MSTPEETQAQTGATALTELFRKHAKIETAQEQLSGVIGRRRSLADSIASAAQQLAVIQAEIARLESEDKTLSAEQAKIEVWLSANAPGDGVSLDDQVLNFVESLALTVAVPNVGKSTGRGRFDAIESELQRSGWADDGMGLIVRNFSAVESSPPAGYVYVQFKANEAGPILTEAGEQTLVVGIAMATGVNEYDLRTDLRRKVLDDLNGSVVEIVSKLNAKADELIHAALDVTESRADTRDLRSPSDDLRGVFEDAKCDSHFVAPALIPAGADGHEVITGHLDDMPGFDDVGVAANEIDEVQGFGGPELIPEAVYEEIPGFADDVVSLPAPMVQEPESTEYQFNF